MGTQKKLVRRRNFCSRACSATFFLRKKSEEVLAQVCQKPRFLSFLFRIIQLEVKAQVFQKALKF